MASRADESDHSRSSAIAPRGGEEQNQAFIDNDSDSGSFLSIRISDDGPDQEAPDSSLSSSPRQLSTSSSSSRHTPPSNQQPSPPLPPPPLPLHLHFPSVGSVASIATPVKDGVVHVIAHWKILLGGQILSFLLSTHGAAQASLHLECHQSAPSFTVALVFLMLAFFLIPLSRQRHLEELDLLYKAPTSHFVGIPLHAPAAVYVLLALLEVQANFVLVSAFRYTTLTSVTLLDTMSLPAAMLLSKVLLHRRYVSLHLIGAAVCLGGVLFDVLGDYQSDLQDAADAASLLDDEPYPDKLKGDILAVSGSIMFGCLHVFREYTVREFGGPHEYLGMTGVFGFLFAGGQAVLLERRDIAALFNGQHCDVGVVVSLILVYVIVRSLSYVGVSHFLRVSESALLNLSFLTSNVYSAAISIFAHDITPPHLFWLAVPITFVGVFLYEAGPSPVVAQ